MPDISPDHWTFWSVSLPGPPAINAKLCQDTRARRSGYLSFEFHLARADNNHASYTHSKSQGVLPESFASLPTTGKIEVAVKWALDLNAKYNRRLLAGKVVHVRIPAHAPMSSQTLAGDCAIGAVWDARATTGQLLRPLFLKPLSYENLYAFQRSGVKWLQSLRAGILADDMGLGKTAQALTALASLVQAGTVRTALVLCPPSLLMTWEHEAQLWARELTRVRITPNARMKASAWPKLVGRSHLLIANYQQVLSTPESLVDPGVDLVIADEAHRIRNLDAKITQGVRAIKRRIFWALTGTPIERDSADIASLLSTLDPARFSMSLATLPVTVLRAQVRPLVLRRLKSQVLDELPSVITTTEELELSFEQRVAYSGALREHDDNPGSRQYALALVTSLRTICDYDPRTGVSSKVIRILELLADIKEQGEKVVVFSYLLQPLRLVESELFRVLKYKASLMEGALDISQRNEMLRSFKEDDEEFVLLASTGVAREGLTLTEANHVIFFNEWWNPSANNQARDRVVRIGQTRAAQIHKFVCKNTIEENLQRILQKKEELFSKVLDTPCTTEGFTNFIVDNIPQIIRDGN